MEIGSNAFCFDLTLRRFSNDNSKLSSYLTYLGNKRMEPSESSFPKFLDPRKDDEDVMTLTLMEDAGKTYWKETPENMAFSSPKMGLFDLSTHGISPRPHSGMFCRPR